MFKCTIRNRGKTLGIKANSHIKHGSHSTLLIWCVLASMIPDQRVHTPDLVFSTLTLDLSAEQKHIKHKQVQRWLWLYSSGVDEGLRGGAAVSAAWLETTQDDETRNILVFHVQPDYKVCFIFWPHITLNGLVFWFCKDADVCSCRQNSNHILTPHKVYSLFTSELPELLLSSLPRMEDFIMNLLDGFNTDAFPFK